MNIKKLIKKSYENEIMKYTEFIFMKKQFRIGFLFSYRSNKFFKIFRYEPKGFKIGIFQLNWTRPKKHGKEF